MPSNFLFIWLTGAVLCFITMSIFGHHVQKYLKVKDVLMVVVYSLIPYLNYVMCFGFGVAYIMNRIDIAPLWKKFEALLERKIL